MKLCLRCLESLQNRFIFFRDLGVHKGGSSVSEMRPSFGINIPLFTECFQTCKNFNLFAINPSYNVFFQLCCHIMCILFYLT